MCILNLPDFVTNSHWQISKKIVSLGISQENEINLGWSVSSINFVKQNFYNYINLYLSRDNWTLFSGYCAAALDEEYVSIYLSIYLFTTDIR